MSPGANVLRLCTVWSPSKSLANLLANVQEIGPKRHEVLFLDNHGEHCVNWLNEFCLIWPLRFNV